MQLFEQASNLSRLQVQAEMEAAFMSDLDRQASSPVGPPASDEALQAFWVEQGLSASAADRMLREMKRSSHVFSVPQLAAIMQRWQRVLPEMDVAELAFRDVEMLSADVRLAIRNLVVIISAFPGKSVFSILRRTPKLLWCEDLPQRVERVVERLTLLHPSRDRAVVGSVVADNAELLYRMDYYADRNITLLDELPIEIQNMFVIADQGLGFLHRYYKRQRSGNYDVDDFDQEAGF